MRCRGHRLGAVLPARRGIPRPAQSDRRAGGTRRGRVPGRHALPGRPRLAAAPRPERAAHPRHRQRRSPGGQHRGQRDRARRRDPRHPRCHRVPLQRRPHRLTGTDAAPGRDRTTRRTP
ncbi:hypothetical protein SGPA1_40702 [Streptomyces misionensis JCM 4497]